MIEATSPIFSEERSTVKIRLRGTSLAITIPTWAWNWIINENELIYGFVKNGKLYITTDKEKVARAIAKADWVTVFKLQFDKHKYPFFYAKKTITRLGWKKGDELEVYAENGFLVYEPVKGVRA